MDGLLEDLESKLDQSNGSKKVKKKVYNVSIEMLQNAFEYVSHDALNEPWLQTITFAVEADGEGFRLLAENYVHESVIGQLETKISEVNALSTDELKTKFREILNNSEFTDKGGAGLGFYDMARKSGQKIGLKLNHEKGPWSLFTLNILIPF